MTKPLKTLHYRIGDKVSVEGYQETGRVVVVNNFDYTLGVEMLNNQWRITVTPDLVKKVENNE